MGSYLYHAINMDYSDFVTETSRKNSAEPEDKPDIRYSIPIYAYDWKIVNSWCYLRKYGVCCMLKLSIHIQVIHPNYLFIAHLNVA